MTMHSMMSDSRKGTVIQSYLGAIRQLAKGAC